jgi:hypothetical protein
MVVLELEGSWEDILRRGAELSGRRVKVSVLSDEPAKPLDEVAERWAAGAERLVPSPLSPARQGDEAELERLLVEKFRKQGFTF